MSINTNGSAHKTCENACDDCPSNAHDAARRKFLGLVVGAINVGIVAVVAGPVVGFLGSPANHQRKREWVAIADVSQLPTDGAVEVTYGVRVVDGYHTVDRNYSVFLRRKGDEVLCIDPACTHLGCRVNYQGDQDRFLCPCHGGVFDHEGNVVSGPPPKHLEVHETKVEAGKIWLLREV